MINRRSLRVKVLQLLFSYYNQISFRKDNGDAQLQISGGGGGDKTKPAAVPHDRAPKRGRPRKKWKRKPHGYVFKTEVRPSTIAGAGLGLFLLEDACKGDRVTTYTGDVLTAAESAKSKSAYRLQVNSNCILDATDESHAPGRYINDGKRAGRAVNVEFGAGTHPATCKQTGRKYVSIFATRNITAGDDGVELLADYGPDYEWSPQPTTIARGSIIKPTRGAKPPATRRLAPTRVYRDSKDSDTGKTTAATQPDSRKYIRVSKTKPPTRTKNLGNRPDCTPWLCHIQNCGIKLRHDAQYFFLAFR